DDPASLRDPWRRLRRSSPWDVRDRALGFASAEARARARPYGREAALSLAGSRPADLRLRDENAAVLGSSAIRARSDGGGSVLPLSIRRRAPDTAPRSAEVARRAPAHGGSRALVGDRAMLLAHGGCPSARG